MAQLTCSCGNVVRFAPERRGSRGRCPGCGSWLVLDDARPAEPPSAPSPAAMPRVSAPPVRLATPSRAEQRRPYLLLLLAFIPLFWTTFFGGKEEPLVPRIERAVEKASPDVQERVDQLEQSGHATLSGVLALLPGGRLDGAFLPKKTIAHWLIAAISAAGFLAAIAFLFPRGSATPRHLVIAGIFTGTIGILLLLLVQVLASLSTGLGISVHGRIGLLLLLAQLIGYSYSAALNPQNGFIPSFLGFTFGVGFCEELTKALPLLHLVRFLPGTRSGETGLRLDARTLCALGLASGVGFGVSEGITYSADYYNGIEGPGIYVVRFVSCVALHAIWCASAALVLTRRRETVQGEIGWPILLPLLQILAVPMLLHGFYDTLLKRGFDLGALAVAIGSFFWLVWCLEEAAKEEPSLA